MSTNSDLISSIRYRLDYNQDTGLLYWQYVPDRPAKYNARWAGKPAFTHLTRNGFLVGLLDGKTIRADRIAWAWRHGEWRTDIFHANAVRTDNRILNLRARGYLASHGLPPEFVAQLQAAGVKL